MAAEGGITVDSGAHGGAAPYVGKSGGVDVLNIAAPNGAGLSHNKFKDYNVSEQGLIINNAGVGNYAPDAKSALSGELVDVNRNFGGGPAAKVILNEVTGNSTTSLKGYTEIYGQRADLVIANPNGITAAGAGFINTDRLTMVTGRPNVENGEIKDFALAPGGIISVEGGPDLRFGLYADGSKAELVSDVIRIAGQVHSAGELALLTGDDRFDYKTGQVSSGAAPRVGVAVDGAMLGGMRAGSIRVFASQTGMGINAPENLVADVSNIEITADGDIVFKTAVAAKDIDVSSGGSVTHAAGAADAGGRVAVSAAKDVTLSGDYVYGGNVSVVAGKDLESGGKLLAEDKLLLASAGNIKLGGTARAKEVGLKAGGDVKSAALLVADTALRVEAGQKLTVSSGHLAGGAVTAKAAQGVENHAQILSGGALAVESGAGLTNFGEIASLGQSEISAASVDNHGQFTAEQTLSLISAAYIKNHEGALLLAGRGLSLTAGGAVENRSQMLSEGALRLSAGGDLVNIGKLNSLGLGEYAAANAHNYGQIMGDAGLKITTANDFINYRDSAVLSGGALYFTVGRNLVNYRAEIFAMGDISFTGQEGKLASLSDAEKAFDLANAAQLYDNPYITDQGLAQVDLGEQQNPNVPGGPEAGEDLDYEFYLTELDELLTVPADAFADDAAPGASYTQGDYIIIYGHPVLDANGNPVLDGGGNPTYSLPDEDDDDGQWFTITKLDGTALAYGIPGQSGGGNGSQGPEDDTALASGGALDSYVTSAAFSGRSDAMNVLANVGGRIESFGGIGINSDRLLNIGVNYNTGSNAASVYYNQLLTETPSRDNEWYEMGRYQIGQVFLNAAKANLLARGDISINAREVENTSSVISAGNNIFITADKLSNRTYSEVYTLSANYKKRWRKWVRGKNRTYSDRRTVTYDTRVYSLAQSLISAGNGLSLKLAQLDNGQSGDTANFAFGRNDAVNTRPGAVNTAFELPRGTNGLFVVQRDNPRYLVVSNTPFLKAGNYVGGGYLLDKLYPNGSTHKFLGDPAYETRLMMDALRAATSGRYLDGERELDEVARMKALYDGAANESERLRLKLGVALTPEQVADLRGDIIWYVEEVVQGQKVLVPQLYLCPTTLMALAGANGAGTLSAKNIEIIGEYIVNSGDIAAAEMLYIQADNLRNQASWLMQGNIRGGEATVMDVGLLHNAGGRIGGGVTQIAAGTLINETRVYEEKDPLRGNVTQKVGDIGTISGDQGLKIDVQGSLISRGAAFESSEGGVYLGAGNIVFDTVEVYNRSVTSQSSGGFLSSSTKTTVHETLQNLGSSVNAAGDVKISSSGDASFRGSHISAGGNALLDVGGNLSLTAAHDYESTRTSTTKSSWGGLKKEKVDTYDKSTVLSGSRVNTAEGLTMVSGRDTNIVGSQVNAGGDASIFAGYRIGEGGLEKSGLGGSVNIVNDYTETVSQKRTEKHDYSKAIENGLKGKTKIDFSDGKLSSTMELGESEAVTDDVFRKQVAGSGLNAGGNLQIGAADDINIVGSNLLAGGNAVFDAKNINIVDAKDVQDTKHIKETTRISSTATVGNAYVDVAMATKAAAEAAEALKQAKNDLDDMKKLRGDGKASDAAVKDAELNLALAMANQANALIALAACASGAATSTSAYGFYASGGITYETAKQETATRAETSVGSTVNAGGNIVFTASENMSQIGSHVRSEEGSIFYGVKGNLNISAGDSFQSVRSSQSSKSVTAAIGNNGVASANAGLSRGSSSSMDVTWSNSTATAENGAVIFDVGGDMRADGFNALAKDINVKVGGDLTLASKQNSSTSRGSNGGINAGITFKGGSGGGVSGVSGGMSAGSSESNREWVDNRSSLIGTESVNADVGGTLHLAGSTIANIKNGVDNGNLNITAADITWQDLQNKEYSSSKGFGFSTSIGLGGSQADAKKAENQTAQSSGGQGSGNSQTPKNIHTGSTTITASRDGHEKEGAAYAAIGQGNITTGSGRDLSSLSRNMNNADTITKDMVTSALDISFELDHRLLTEAGREDIIDDASNFVDNIDGILQKPIDAAIRNINAMKAELPEDLWILEGIGGREVLKGMVQNGISQDDAEAILYNEDFQEILAASHWLTLALQENAGNSYAMHTRSGPIYEDGSTLFTGNSSRVTDEPSGLSIGQKSVYLMAAAKEFLDSLPGEQERQVAMIGLKLATGGPVKFVIGTATSSALNSLDVVKNAKDGLFTATTSYLDEGEMLSKQEYAERYSNMYNFRDYIAGYGNYAENPTDYSDKAQEKVEKNIRGLEFFTEVITGVVLGKKKTKETASKSSATTSNHVEKNGLDIKDPSLGRGSTGRTTPNNLKEQMAMKEAMSNPAGGNVLSNVEMKDARWPASEGWQKISMKVNKETEIHYVRNVNTGQVDDFKFKDK